MLNKLFNNPRGFTLIELLITISIIAILATIGITTYSSVMKQGRDSKRQSDLKSIQSALEQYFADQLYYPATLTSPLSAGSKTYLNNVPTDPLPSPKPQYTYTPLPLTGTTCDNSTSTKCAKYCLYANLEGTTTSSLSGCSSTIYYNFAVTPP